MARKRKRKLCRSASAAGGISRATRRPAERHRRLARHLVLVAASLALVAGPGRRVHSQVPPSAPPALAVSEHPLGQVSDAFKDAATAPGATLFRCSFVPSSADPIDIALLDFNLSGVAGLFASDFTGLELVEDANANGVAEPAETIRRACTVSILGSTGTITAATPFQISGPKSYVLTGNLVSLSPGDAAQISFTSANLVAKFSGSSIVVSGQAAAVSHQEGSPVGIYYVSASRGADSNEGTQEGPWRTLSKAAASVPAGGTVIIEPGTYPGGVTIDTPGDANARITFLGDQRTGEVLVDAASQTFGFQVSNKSRNQPRSSW